MNQKNYTQEEWEIFIKVLGKVSKDPFDVPDVLKMKGLISKTYKSARKKLRKDNVKELRKSDLEKIEETKIVKLSKLKIKSLDSSDNILDNSFDTLNSSKKCYSCSKLFKEIHFFYHRLCPECALLNYEKRNQRINLKNRTVLITGARIKIGYETALRFLRDGARVIALTRFPENALINYSNEKDFDVWKDNLKIYGIDLRNISRVEEFIEHLYETEPHIDIIVNNAAQTIKRPLEYYSSLIEVEKNKKNLIKDNSNKLLGYDYNSNLLLEIESKYPVIFSEKSFFPQGKVDEFNEQLDLRPQNSWNQKLEEIDSFELIEVHVINSIVPFIFASKLKKLLQKSQFNEKFIINVSSSEGQFSYPNKSIYHPHNNMSKASLNMLTRTSSEDYAIDNIYINSVDVGWVSSGNTFEKKQKLEDDGFVHPLDLIDASSRIYDPIVQGISGNIIYGKLLKNYKEVDW